MFRCQSRVGSWSLHSVLACLAFFGLLFVDCLGDQTAQAQEGDKNIGRSGVVLLQPLSESAPVRNAGLFMGVNEFTADEHISKLEYAVHDAVELAAMFVFELKLIPAKNCYVMLSGQPSAASVKQHLAQLKQAGATVEVGQRSQILIAFRKVRDLGRQPSDLLVCAFSSHGFNEKRQAFVMPGDGVKDLLSATAISLDDIETSLETSKAGHKLLLVDACQERISAKSESNAGEAMSAVFQDALKRPTGQAKLASCSPGEFSYEHASLGGVGHGIFTHSFLEALRGGAKVDAQNFVCLGSVADYVSLSVTDWTKAAKRKPQTPFLSGPATSQKLPLALKADDLATLIAGVKRQPVSALFTADLRTRLVEQLSQLSPQKEADRELLSATRDFVRGSYAELRFVPYLKEDMQRWRGTMPKALEAPFKQDAAKAAQEAWAKHLKTKVVIENTIGMKLALIPAGEFEMREESDAQSDAYRVLISQPFYLGVYEVTQSQYARVMGTNPSWFSKTGSGKVEVSGLETSDCPVETVSWHDAQEFCRKLSALTGEKSNGRSYRLPTDAEWEYACRAGTKTYYHFGDVLNGDKANVDGTLTVGTETKGPRLGRTTTVGRYVANAFGLYDMYGNVSEWCEDVDDKKAYSQRSGLTTDPLVMSGSDNRVLRGGSWGSYPWLARSAFRSGSTPDLRSNYVGFRVVCASGVRTR